MKMRWLLSLIFVVSVSAHAEQASTPTAAASESQELSAAATAEPNDLPKTESKDVTKNDNRKESEILLNLESNKKAASEGGGLFRILFTLSMLGVVGTGAFFFLRKYKVPKAMKHQTQIKVLQQHYLGPKKSLAIVRVAGESILIGVTDHNISMIKSLSLLDDEVPEEAPQSFGKVLGQSNSKNVDFDDTAAEEETPPSRKRSAKDLDLDEEFAISGIKDIVSKRLKGMRSFQ
ncbi:FliO/MopB family protein [Bdellovibrio bacteriovorus]|uniref:Polar flagellar assembly protein FliO n=1 Tax=Bdellovibrio bacteriovorus str. Tiberius TaxID=1069642 RepID=K7ZGY2_BDEBC|nr:flagellar biosynthetic protein FliO [Bdellovibrio bacteriovorus]AFY02922.1 polar flagellar assembly protein FliO [Bdellovibrio bacteriovorus str. Tiberius]